MQKRNALKNPLILKYLKKYKEEPNSVIFAPLAEAYRKEGLIEEAMDICKEGLSNHPDLPSGRVALARCYADIKKFSPVIKLLKTVVDRFPENIIALELYSRANLEIKNYTDAYEYFNRLFRLLPDRSDIAEIIQSLQNNIPDIQEISPEINEADSEDNEESEQSNNVKSVDNLPKTPSKLKSQSSLTTHTLVDLYITQGKIDLAISVLNHILQFEPNDAAAQSKLKELNSEERVDDRVQVLEKLLKKVVQIRQNRVANDFNN